MKEAVIQCPFCDGDIPVCKGNVSEDIPVDCPHCFGKFSIHTSYEGNDTNTGGFKCRCVKCGQYMEIMNEWIGLEAICPQCGKKFIITKPQDTIQTPKVSSRSRDSYRIKNGPIEATGVSSKSRTSYAVCAVLLGGAGIHNFYSGHTVYGLIKLLCNIFFFWTGIVPVVIYIWTCVEIFTQDKDASGEKMIGNPGYVFTIGILGILIQVFLIALSV